MPKLTPRKKAPDALQKPKTKKCKVCGKKFEQWNSLVVWCSPQCGYQLSKKWVEQTYIKETKRLRSEYRANSKAYQKDLAGKTCRKYIRLRDKDEPCIDCGRYDIGSATWQAGHFKTQGAYPELKYHEFNISKQCSQCNQWGKNGTDRYRKNLIKKIGLSNVEWLEGPQQPQNLTLEDIKDVNWWYKEQIKHLERIL